MNTQRPAGTIVDVILPCLDEAAALPWVLQRMPADYHPIVADNGSHDGSAQIAASLGATVVSATPRGFGAACWAGLAVATTTVVCFMDADGSFDPQQLPRVADPVLARAADLVLGARHPTDRRAWPAHARIANHALARRINAHTGLRLKDCGPMRAARREQLLALGLADRRFGWPLEMVLRASHAGWRIAETEVDYLPRTGRSKVTGTVKGTLRAVRDMQRALHDIDVTIEPVTT
jgi:glycosyltransferase involved in cell wall biosynthesis